MSALLDPRGCLTEEGFAALDSAPPGRGPQEAAAHLAACPRCQRRYLARAGRDGAGIRLVPGKAEAPPLWRTFVIVVAALLLVATAIFGMRLIRG
jgi:hypothetical protein